MRRQLLTIVITLFSLIFMASCGNYGHLKVGADLSLKPLAFTQEGMQRGFEIDLWDAVAKEAGLTYELQPMPVGEILQKLQQGKVDAGLAAFTVKGDRKKSLDFSIPYYDAGQVIMVRSDNFSISSAKDLEAKTIATRMATSGDEVSSRIKGVKEVRGVPDFSTACEQLLKREVDAVIFDSPVIYDYVKNGGSGKVKTVGKLMSNEQYGVALTKGSSYKGRINNALRTLGDNGTYEELYTKWFGEKPKTVPGDR